MNHYGNLFYGIDSLTCEIHCFDQPFKKDDNKAEDVFTFYVISSTVRSKSTEKHRPFLLFKVFKNDKRTEYEKGAYLCNFLAEILNTEASITKADVKVFQPNVAKFLEKQIAKKRLAFEDVKQNLCSYYRGVEKFQNSLKRLAIARGKKGSISKINPPQQIEILRKKLFENGFVPEVLLEEKGEKEKSITLYNGFIKGHTEKLLKGYDSVSQNADEIFVYSDASVPEDKENARSQYTVGVLLLMKFPPFDTICGLIVSKKATFPRKFSNLPHGKRAEIAERYSYVFAAKLLQEMDFVDETRQVRFFNDCNNNISIKKAEQIFSTILTKNITISCSYTGEKNTLFRIVDRESKS